MKVTQEKFPASQVCFNIEVEGEKSQAIYDRIVKDLTRSMQVPGFRKGKAPKQLILRQIGTEQIKANVLEELLEKTLQKVYEDEKESNLIGSFKLNPVIDELLGQFTVGQDLSFQAIIDIQPEVKLAKYQAFSIQAEKLEPDLTQVEKTLNQFQVKNATLVPVEERGAEIGDVVTMDLKVLDENGQEIEESGAEDVQADMDEAEFIPDLIKNIVGMNVGETKEIPLVLPDDYYMEDYAGKPATFIVTINDLKVRELPELDDDFAQSISEKATIVELKEFLEKRIVDEAEEKTQENVEAAILDSLTAELEVELPETMIRQEVDFMIQQQAMYLQRTQKDSKLIKQLFTKEFIAEMRLLNEPEAIKRIKRTLSLAEVAKLEEIKATPEEIRDRVERILEVLGNEPYDTDKVNQIAEDELVTEKVLEWLKQNSTLEFVPVGTLAPKIEDEVEEKALDADDSTLEATAITVDEETDEPDTSKE